jgi:hypothetical protein
MEHSRPYYDRSPYKKYIKDEKKFLETLVTVLADSPYWFHGKNGKSIYWDFWLHNEAKLILLANPSLKYTDYDNSLTTMRSIYVVYCHEAQMLAKRIIKKRGIIRYKDDAFITECIEWDKAINF